MTGSPGVPNVSPTLLLLVVAALTAGVALSSIRSRRRQQRALADLAARHGWAYRSGPDSALARRIGPHLPDVGAADVRVIDLFERDGRVVATAHYALGTLGGRREVTRLIAADLAAGTVVGRLSADPPGSPTALSVERRLGGAIDRPAAGEAAG